MFGRMRQGWQLTKKSWGVVRTHPALAKLPFTGGAIGLIVMVVLGLPAVLLLNSDDGANQVIGWVLLAIAMYIASSVVIFYNVALASAADDVLQGSEPDLREARNVARSRLGVVLSWAAIVLVVSMLLALIRDRGGPAGSIFAAIGGAIWSLVTFMVIPVVALEGIGPIAAMKRSASLFRKRWGEQVTGNVAIGGIAGLATVVAVLVVVGGVALIMSGSLGLEALGVVLVIVGAVAAIAAGVFAGATKGVFGVALYHYMADEEVVGPFVEGELASAARSR